MQYRQDVRHIGHNYNRKKSCLPIHVAQKITVIRAQKIGKIRGLKFDTLYWRHQAAYRKI